MTGANFRFKARRKTKKEDVSKTGKDYCKNFSSDNMTCIKCFENEEGTYRPGCFKKAK